MLVVALRAGSDMPAERSGPASLDRGHHLQLWQVQVSGMFAAIGRPMGAEDIRDLQSGAGHPSRGLSGTGFPLHQQIERAGHIPDRLDRHLGIDCCGLQLGVPEHLDHPDIRPSLQQMCGKAVSQRMGETFFLIPAKSQATPKARLNCRVEIGSTRF